MLGTSCPANFIQKKETEARGDIDVDVETRWFNVHINISNLTTFQQVALGVTLMTFAVGVTIIGVNKYR
jgi:hypothetical protein